MKMTKQLAFYFNSSICTGCKACAIACKDRSDLPVGVNWRRVYQYEGGNWIHNPTNASLLIPNNVYVYSISISCMHCQDPACVNVCPTTAMYKRDDGVVLVDANKCIGCRYCEWACPYGAPQFSQEKGVMTKCDFCQDLQAQGQNPVCVDACVMRAIEFGDLEELRAKYGDIQAVDPLPDPNITKPSFEMTPHKNSQPVGSGNGKIATLSEEV
jgi:anaerobic dimethyl sulfoxide reductase subunit B (iron-sulfur subunit)